MNISSVGSIGLSVSDVDSMNMIDISILKKSLDAVEQNGDFLIQMMEQSINPNLGSNIDIRL
ncbi:MAG: YjfB family protein [Lachnospiraceae bacterium]|nr:YjfB family protein [Lachnospiraceae bacterium]